MVFSGYMPSSGIAGTSFYSIMKEIGSKPELAKNCEAHRLCLCFFTQQLLKGLAHVVLTLLLLGEVGVGLGGHLSYDVVLSPSFRCS